MKAEDIITKAKIQVMTKSIFYTTLMLGLKHKISDNVPTAAVDGITIFYNRSFVEKLTIEECTGLIMHEVGHVAYQHINRRGDRHPKKWNMAGDYMINNTLIAEGYEIPFGGLVDDQYIGLSTDQIYNKLPDVKLIEYECDIIEGNDAETTSAINQQIIELVAKAKLKSNMLDGDGLIDDEITRTLLELIDPKLDWTIVLSNFMKDFSNTDYSFTRPNKRFFPEHYLPSRYSPSIKSLVVAIDTSGSVSQEEIREYLSEIDQLRKIFDIEKLTIIPCDDRIRNIINVKPYDNLLDLEIQGGSWTKTKPVLDYCNENNPVVLVYFTDLEVYDIPEEEQSYDIVWINTYDDRVAPIGRTININ